MWRLTNDDDDMGNGYSRYHDNEEDDESSHRKLEYINDIPPIFTDPKVMEQYYVAIENNQDQIVINNKHGYIHLNYHPI